MPALHMSQAVRSAKGGPRRRYQPARTCWYCRAGFIGAAVAAGRGTIAQVIKESFDGRDELHILRIGHN